MKNSNIELTQLFLDRFQPGKDAVAVLSDWDIQLVSNSLPDIHVLKHLLYDGFSQSDFSRRDSSKIALINQTSFLMKELVYRYLTKVLDKNFITQSKTLFDQASAYRQLYNSVSGEIRDIENKPEFAAVHRSVKAEFEIFDPLLRDVYLMGDSTRILKEVGTKIRALYPEDVSRVPDLFGGGFSPEKRNNPFKLAGYEEMNRRREEAEALVEQMSDQELCLRLTRSFDVTGPAGTDTSRPVYGVKTVYAYVPLIMARLMNGWSFDNERVMNELSTQMTESTAKLLEITARLKRVHESRNDRQLGYIAERFGDGECAVFSVALHHITGFPVVVLEVAESNDPGLPVGFPRHAAIQISDDQFIDAYGLTNSAELNARFDCALRIDRQPNLNASIFDPAWSVSGDDNEDILEARGFAKQMLKIKGLEGQVAPAKRRRDYEYESSEP
jgi:hypothetical protein